MTWDYFVFIADTIENINNTQEISVSFECLASGFVDEVSLRFFLGGDKERARKNYIDKARKSDTKNQKCDFLSGVVPDFSHLPSLNWIGLQVDFELLTPWYSKDDRVFHVLDNPVRKDRVFGVPFMAASSWKGMLRWACRMRNGLREHLERHNNRLDNWRDPDWILHLFGNEKEEKENFRQGALVFYPTWFNKIGFEVINPHSRERRAGTQPIYYEVVPEIRPNEEGGKGTLSLLYAPWPGMKFSADSTKFSADPKEVLPKLLEAIEYLLTVYGISAKRTVGWGTAKITEWRAFHKDGGEVKESDRGALWKKVQTWLSVGGTP
ncbi:RAMP superfamily CRISPR-associated protein [Brockia lithotrophica]|uniref:CRISPR-associated protein Cmr2 n=1 Tax=Brockia lithotrophica TaxID=933949 RepID=A0A660KWH4_9BACL|nr:RAMP superfamily CRISPR-associated protein [Brockia lithotrophica]RKQ84651.1 CRISPR-associated protein Cmr2 [Brockia lithotrophica]